LTATASGERRAARHRRGPSEQAGREASNSKWPAHPAGQPGNQCPLVRSGDGRFAVDDLMSQVLGEHIRCASHPRDRLRGKYVVT
jgi:hypothetical protein